jgi:C-terminal processing protease CtpA/Prc
VLTVMDRARMRTSAPIVWRSLEGGDFDIKRDPVFEGPVAMLIDARTFSAAEDTVAVFRLMRRGVIVGTASAGSTGQPWLVDLPGGGSARICVKRDSYPDGTTFVGTGIIPDIEAPLTVADIRNGNDAALDRAAQALTAR